MALELNLTRLDVLGVLENGTVRAPSVPTNLRKTLSLPRGVDASVYGKLVYPNGQPVDLAGQTIASYLTVKKHPDSTAIVSQIGAVQATDGLGIVKWSITNGQFLYQPFGRYLWDWRVKVNATNGGTAVPTSPWILEPSIGAPDAPTFPVVGPNYYEGIVTFAGEATLPVVFSPPFPVGSVLLITVSAGPTDGSSVSVEFTNPTVNGFNIVPSGPFAGIATWTAKRIA